MPGTTDHPADPLRLTIEFDRGGELPSGWVEDENGGRRQFAGLLELICLLDPPRDGPRHPT